MGDLFNTKGNQYNDNGDLIVNQITMIESGEFTQQATTKTGAIANMYDLDMTSVYYLFDTTAAVTEQWVKWDMKRKQKFKNIIAYVTGNAGTGTMTAKLQGSNDNSAWTDLDSVTWTTVQTNTNLVTNDVTYRYIRIHFQNAAASTVRLAGVYHIKATS